MARIAQIAHFLKQGDYAQELNKKYILLSSGEGFAGDSKEPSKTQEKEAGSPLLVVKNPASREWFLAEFFVKAEMVEKD